MVKRRLMFTFSSEPMSEPIIYNLGHQFNVVTNIHRASATEEQGWFILDLEGEEKDIEDAITWVTSKGVRVDPVEG